MCCYGVLMVEMFDIGFICDNTTMIQTLNIVALKKNRNIYSILKYVYNIIVDYL